MAALYEKTIAYLLQFIDENGLQSGDQLPPESKLALQAGVSLVTVRRALSELASQSVVRREQGRGTCVLRPRVRAETTRVGGLRNSLHLDARSSLLTRVLGCQARRASCVWPLQRAPARTGGARVTRTRLITAPGMAGVQVTQITRCCPSSPHTCLVALLPAASADPAGLCAAAATRLPDRRRAPTLSTARRVPTSAHSTRAL